jgi:hypothetical protein
MAVHIHNIDELSHVARNIQLALHQASLDDRQPDHIIDKTVATAEALALAGRDSASIWLAQTGEVRPSVRFYSAACAQTHEIFLAGVAEDVRSNARIAAALGIIVAGGKIDGYFITAEAWVAYNHRDPEVNAMQIRDRSDRQEMVVVSAANRRRHVLRLFPIFRDDNAKVTGLGAAERMAAGVSFDNPIFTSLYGIAALIT